MIRKLRPDTFNKQINHYFRQITGLTPTQATIRCFNTPVLRDQKSGFEISHTDLRGLTLHGQTPADSRILIQTMWQERSPIIAHAKSIAAELAMILASTKENDYWPTLGELSELYAQIAKIGGQPIQIALPRNQGCKTEFRYPRINMTERTHATTEISTNYFIDIELAIDKIKEDALIDKKSQGHLLDRTTIETLALLALKQGEQFNQFGYRLEQIIDRKKVTTGPYTINNAQDHIAIENITWNQSDGQWIEYLDGTISLRNQQVPAIMLHSINGERLDTVVQGMPLLGQATISKATNPKNYLMKQRQKTTGCNTAPTLRLKLANEKMTLRKAGIRWDGPSPKHQAIIQSDNYQATLQGPFASPDASRNLDSLLAIAQEMRLM